MKMTNRYCRAAILVIFSLTSGCALINRGPSVPDPVNDGINEMISHYGFFMKGDDRNNLKACLTVECINTWKDEFCAIRNCSEIDQRISNVENEIFATDLDIPAFTFRINGGLRGDVAKVYLILGSPAYKDQMVNNNFLSDLMLWIYIDEGGNPYRFLFYKKTGVGSYRLFEYQQFRYIDQLAEISKFMLSGQDGLEYVDAELRRNDINGLFRSAMYQFSPTSVSLRNKLAAPDTTEEIIAELGFDAIGMPSIPEDLKFEFSKYHSFIPGRFGHNINNEGISRFFFITQYSSLDWTIFEDGAKCYMFLTLFFTNRDNQEVYMHEGNITLAISDSKIKNPDRYFPFVLPVKPDNIPVGSYIVEAYLQNVFTKKYNVWTIDLDIN
jgi:hypothetical protein